MSTSETSRRRMSACIQAAALLAWQLIPLTALASPVTIAGQPAFNVTAGGASRTSTIQRNIDNALVASSDKSPKAASVIYVKGQPVITLGGFYVTTIDTGSAKLAHTTPALLAQKWVNGLKDCLKNRQSVDSYIAQLTGSRDSTTGTAGSADTGSGRVHYYQRGKIVYIPAGMMVPVSLNTDLSTENAHKGDRVEAQVAETINLGDATIARGSILTGTVTESTPAEKMGKSGILGIKFDMLKTIDGQNVPIAAHIVGGIGKYREIGSLSNLVQGESTSDKVKQALMRGAIGAGGGALVGTAIGAIASHGWHTGRGAIAGTIIGGALGVGESLLLRKGDDVKVASGQTLDLQLDAPATIAAVPNPF